MEQNGEDKKREKLHNKGLMNVRLKISFFIIIICHQVLPEQQAGTGNYYQTFR